jgi:integrase
LKADSLTDISIKIMDSAGMKKTQGNRGGFRIFRHHLATGLLGNGVAEPIISKILGHTSPDSLAPYLSADFQHLKKCALSIDLFPMSEGVFKNV